LGLEPGKKLPKARGNPGNLGLEPEQENAGSRGQPRPQVYICMKAEKCVAKCNLHRDFVAVTYDSLGGELLSERRYPVTLEGMVALALDLIALGCRRLGDMRLKPDGGASEPVLDEGLRKEDGRARC